MNSYSHRNQSFKTNRKMHLIILFPTGIKLPINAESQNDYEDIYVNPTIYDYKAFIELTSSVTNKSNE